MGQENQNETERTKTLPDSTQGVGRPREPDDDGSSTASGSPKNLLVVAIVVALLFFAGVMFRIAADFVDSHDTTRDNWQLALYVLSCIGTGIFYSGLLLGWGTLATAGFKAVAARLDAIARLLTSAGVVLVILGIAESVCIVGTDVWSGWQGDASMVALRMGTGVFEAGVLAGLALFCQRRSRRGGWKEEKA